jgi:5-methylcytosine-specific restriction endonuclease McrA
MENVIVLNSDYSFLNVVTPKKAFSYIARGKVTIEKYAEKVFNTAEKIFKIPLVIRFTYLIRQVYKRKIPWSKRNVCIRDNYTCAYCGVKQKRMTVDHVVPKVHGGKNTFENTVCACKPCNNKKGDKTTKECGMYPSHKMVQPTITEFMKIWHKQFGIDEIINSLWE